MAMGEGLGERGTPQSAVNAAKCRIPEERCIAEVGAVAAVAWLLLRVIGAVVGVMHIVPWHGEVEKWYQTYARYDPHSMNATVARRCS